MEEQQRNTTGRSFSSQSLEARRSPDANDKCRSGPFGAAGFAVGAQQIFGTQLVAGGLRALRALSSGRRF
jgi:hypothetical protein